MNINTPNNPFKSALTYFNGVMNFDEAEQDIRNTHVNSTYGLRKSIKVIEDYLNSGFDILEIRNFVEYEMNRAIGDPTGVQQLEWIKSALALEKRVLLDLEKEH